MPSDGGIRSTVEFSPPVGCPVAEVSTQLDSPIRSVRPSIPPSGGPPPVLEFTCNSTPTDVEDLKIVFSTDNLTLCRISHRGEPACPCTCLGEHEIPITRYRADDGTLTIVFHSTDFEELRATMATLQERFPTLDIRRLVRTPTDHHDEDYVMFDTGVLTERQLQMLEVAHDRGYFQRPRETNATEIAAEFEIDPSTFREHVNLALSKILESVLTET